MEDINNILSLGTNVRYIHANKGTVLQHEGEITSNAFIVKKGLLRSYSLDVSGKKHIFSFAYEGWIIGDLESQEFNQPTELFIDCLEDSEVYVFERNSYLNSDLTREQLQKNAHLLARRVAVLQKRVLMLLSASAKERYLYFLELYPELPNRVPQYMIASYLGITPQALSTIRAKLAKKN